VAEHGEKVKEEVEVVVVFMKRGRTKTRTKTCTAIIAKKPSHKDVSCWQKRKDEANTEDTKLFIPLFLKMKSLMMFSFWTVGVLITCLE